MRGRRGRGPLVMLHVKVARQRPDQTQSVYLGNRICSPVRGSAVRVRLKAAARYVVGPVLVITTDAARGLNNVSVTAFGQSLHGLIPNLTKKMNPGKKKRKKPDPLQQAADGQADPGSVEGGGRGNGREDTWGLG